MTPTRLNRIAAALLLATSVAAGCGDGRPKTYPVNGKLVYTDGAPVPGATITFIITADEKATAARGRVNPDGTFRLTTFEDGDGAIAGEHLVAVVPLPQPEDARGPLPVPPVYADAAKSGLKATVTPDTRDVIVTIDRTGKR